MAFRKLAKAYVSHPIFGADKWQSFIDHHKRQLVPAGKVASKTANLAMQASEILGEDFDPANYLLTHCTIVASVDVEESPAMSKLGRIKDPESGEMITRKWSDFRIVPQTIPWINNNNDAWSRPVLMKSYRTFIGGHNFQEHVQIEAQSKGRIIDAVARDVGPSVYTDILLATHRKHAHLIQDIEGGRLNTLSMGCSVTETQCSKCGNVAKDETEFCFPPETRVLLASGNYIPISDIREGEQVVTHLGNRGTVTHTFTRHYNGEVVNIEVDGVPVPIQATPNHPFLVMRPRTHCECGCGERLEKTVEHKRGSAKAFFRRFKPHHSTKVRDINSSQEFPDFEFVEADEISAGDYLVFSGYGVVEDTQVSEEKAELIGLFLAEGSFIKRDGKRVGIEFAFGWNEEDTLATHCANLLRQSFGTREPTLQWEELITPEVLPVKHRRGCAEASCPRCCAPSEYQYNAGKERHTCKVCHHTWKSSSTMGTVRTYRSSNEEKGTTRVRLMDSVAANFFFEWCGEYSPTKQLNSKAVAWPHTLQHRILSGWFSGDGTNIAQGAVGCTTSRTLADQMRLLATRCGVYARQEIVVGQSTLKSKKVSSGLSVQEILVRDEYGLLPLHRVVIPSPPPWLGPKFTASSRPTLKVEGNEYKRIRGSSIYRVRKTSRVPYHGEVYNFEVQGDNSYVVEGVAVHNCQHIRYEKGNTFYDERGMPNKIAELCGHESIDPTGGVQFIEASWVGTPAFTGAVMRNIIQPEEIDTATFQKILKSKATEPNPNATPKAANLKRRAEDFDFDMGGEDEAPAPDEAKKEEKEKDPLREVEDELEQTVVDRVKKRIQDRLQKEEQAKSLKPEGELATSNDSNVFKEASRKIAYQTSLDIMARTAASDATLISQVAMLNRRFGIYIPNRIYRASLKVGPTSKYGSLQNYLRSCQRVLGSITPQEATTLVRLGHLLNKRKRTVS